MNVKGLLAATLFVLAGLTVSSGAHAQTVFCPSSVKTTDSVDPLAGTISGITLTGGACTNPAQKGGVNAGAFSGAALAGQAVGNLAQSMSNVETVTATQSIQGRRATEAATCPPGQTFIDGLCRPTPLAPVVARPVPQVRRASTATQPLKAARPSAIPLRRTKPQLAVIPRRRPAPSRAPAPEVVEAAPFAPPVLIIPAHYGAWAQGFGDYEERSGKSTNSLQCCSNLPGATQLNLSASSKTTSEGFVGGIDWTKRDFLYGGDGLILGVMAGYLESDVKVNTSVVSTAPPGAVGGLSNGFGNLKAHLSGPSLGGYVTYFNGPWSNDFLIKNDFLDLNESFTDTQAFQVCNCFPGTFNPFTSVFTGSGKASLDEFTVSDNLNYRIPLMARLWMEPTGGVQYTLSSYSGGAAALGLKDGDMVRLQGGSRFGIDGVLGDTKVTTTLTGLVYDDVVVSGNFIQGGVFGTSGNILNDQGKLRGEGVLAVKFDFGGGKSAFLQADVRGGDGLFGAGGKGGFRVEW